MLFPSGNIHQCVERVYTLACATCESTSYYLTDGDARVASERGSEADKVMLQTPLGTNFENRSSSRQRRSPRTSR
jgi:hypothetical protein